MLIVSLTLIAQHHSTEIVLVALNKKLHATRSVKLSLVLIHFVLTRTFNMVNYKTLLSILTSLGIT